MQAVFFGIFCICLSLALGGQNPATIFGISIDGGPVGSGIYQFSTDDPAELTYLFAVENAFYQSGDFTEDGDWLISDNSKNIWRMDTLTGDKTFLLSTSTTFKGLTYSPVAQQWYGTNGTQIFGLDMEAEEETLIGDFNDGINLFSIAADLYGNIYGIDANTDSLYQLNTLTGEANSIGALGLNVSYGFDMAFDRSTQMLFFTAFFADNLMNPQLFTVDIATGQATSLGTLLDNAQMTALAIPYTMPSFGYLEGLVLNAENQPIEDALVKITNNTLNQTTHLLTNEQGFYSSITFLGEHILDVSADGYLPFSTTKLIENASVYTCDFTLQVSDFYLVFELEDQNGNPINEAEISFNDSSYVSDVNGLVVVENVAPNGYDYLVEAEGFYFEEGDVLIENESDTVQVVLTENTNIAKNLVVVEEMAGTWCSACPAAANGCEELVSNEHPVAIIAYHVDDEFETMAGRERITDFYEITNLPATFFDGLDPYTAGGGANSSTYAPYAITVEEKFLINTPVALSFKNTFLDTLNQIFSTIIEIEAVGRVYGNDHSLHIVLTESYIEHEWLGLNEINFTERAMYSVNGVLGIPIDMEQGDIIEENITFELSPNWNLENCQVIAFIQNNQTKEILNGQQINDLVQYTLVETGINTMGNIAVQVYPNPMQDFLNVESDELIQMVSLKNLEGKTVITQHPAASSVVLDTGRLESGMYFLTIRQNDDIQCLKVFKF